MSNWWDADPVANAAPAQAQPSPFADAISGIESGGNYRAVGPATKNGDRAFGKYQVMGANIAPWTQEVLGRSLTRQEFLTSPELQDKVFEAKFGSYAEKYGPEGAAKAWFAGERGMNNPNAKDVLGTSVSGYAEKFNKALGPQEISAQSRKPVGNWWDADPVADATPQAPLSDAPTRITVNPQQAQQPAAPDIGRGTAFLTGAEQGLNFNFADEKRGAQAAAGTPKDLQNPFSGPSDAIIGLAKLGYEYMTGGDEAAKRYAAGRDEFRQQTKTAGEQYPGTTIAGNIAGAVALPVGGMMQAATLPSRMARGAAVGAGYGALSGAGEGENLTDRATRATTGGIVGGVIGGVAPPIVETAIQGVTRAAGPMVNAVRGAANPGNEAARRVAEAVTRDARADPTSVGRLTPQEFIASGGEARLIDLGGETTRGLARSAANTSPEGRHALSSAIDDRFEGQTGRITNWLRQSFHYPNANAQREALEQTAQATNTPAYARAMHDGANGVWNPELQRLAGAPAIQDAARSAIPALSNRSISEGFRAPRHNPLTVDPETGVARLTSTPNGNQIVPDLRFWDQVKKNLDSAIGKAERNADNAKVQELTALRARLVEQLDAAVPAYQQARAGAAHFFGAENALQAGQNFVMQNNAVPQVRQALARMSPQERRLFQDGFVSRYIETLERTGDRRNILNQVADTPAAREKLNLALGPQRANELEARLRVEGIMDMARSAVQGNSTTARQLAELGFAGGAGSLGAYGTYNMDPTQITIAAVSGALLAGKRGIDSRVSRHVAELLVSNNPQQVQRGVALVARNTRFMDALRTADTRIAQIGAQESPKGALVQVPSTSRAEDEQPNVPRPPGQ